MAKKSVNDISCQNRRVLMRVDFNVPLDTSGVVVDDRRIQMALPTIREVLSTGGRLILMSHLGRPAGNGFEPSASLRPVAARLDELLGPSHPVVFAPNCIGPEADAAVKSVGPGHVVVLENLRFHKGEKSNDPEFARALAAHGEVYVNDAFGTAHRNHASMVGVPERMLDHPRVAGLLLLKELEYLHDAIARAQSPFYAVLGGAKVSDKLGALDHLMNLVDVIMVGGAMAYTFLQGQGQEVGQSLVEEDMIETARTLLQKAAHSGTSVLLPTDHRCAPSPADADAASISQPGIPSDLTGLDIGPETADRWRTKLAEAKTVVWNGPMGMFEVEPFNEGSRAVAEGVVKATAQSDAVTIVGGGETAAALASFGLSSGVSHVSTGGGASLAMLEGKSFKSVELLEDS